VPKSIPSWTSVMPADAVKLLQKYRQDVDSTFVKVVDNILERLVGLPAPFHAVGYPSGRRISLAQREKFSASRYSSKSQFSAFVKDFYINF
jgi:hypothetical protein